MKIIPPIPNQPSSSAYHLRNSKENEKQEDKQYDLRKKFTKGKKK